MKMTKTLPFFSVCLVLCLALPGNQYNLKPFSWLEGEWTMKTKRGMITESWKANHDSSMLGNSTMISASGEVWVLENLELAYLSGNYYYISRVNGQNNGEAVRFKISVYTETGFVAENPGHDFPRRITYRLINKDSIHAFIDGGPMQPEKKSDFYYSRVKK